MNWTEWQKLMTVITRTLKQTLIPCKPFSLPPPNGAAWQNYLTWSLRKKKHAAITTFAQGFLTARSFYVVKLCPDEADFYLPQREYFISLWFLIQPFSHLAIMDH